MSPIGIKIAWSLILTLIVICATQIRMGSSMEPIVGQSDLIVDKLNLKIKPSELKRNNNRISRALQEITLADPLDCLSAIVCGLNTFPPRVPSLNTAVANDYAYLLKTVLIRLKKTPRNPTTENPNKSIKTKKKDDETEIQDDEDSEEDEQDINENSEEETENDDVEEDKIKSKNQDEDVANLGNLHPPFGMYRNSRAIKLSSKIKKGLKNSKKNNSTKIITPLQRLRLETDIREKLRSDAQCLNGILNHTCPFRYDELMILTSGVLERQKVISYNSNKVLPMVGYLLKSRSLTETLKSTFFALEKINNVTIAKDLNKESITFNNVYDEITNGDIGGNGIQIVETKNEDANTNSWEDDEFDEALHNPVIKKENISAYAIKNRRKKKPSTEEEESDEGESEETQASSPDLLAVAEENNSETVEEETSREDPPDIPLPPLYGVVNNIKNIKTPSLKNVRNTFTRLRLALQ